MIVSPEKLNVAEVIYDQARQRPDAPALLLPGGEVTFAQLASATSLLADKLSRSGVQPAQVVGVSMMQTPLHLTTLFALAQIGAVSVPIHALIPKERRLLAAHRFDAAWIVSGREEMRLDGLPFINVGQVDFNQSILPVPVAPVSTDAPFRIAISSGTSGDPKGVMFTHGYMLDRMRKSNYACTSTSRILVQDLNFVIGFVFAMATLSVGGAVIFPSSASLGDVIEAARTQAATHWLLSPAQAQQIVDELGARVNHFPAIEHLRIVGAKPGTKLLQTIKTRFSSNVFVPYGSTEMGPVTMATPEMLERYPDSCGQLFPWAKAEIVDEFDQPVSPESWGHLRLRVEGMLTGYHRDPLRSEKQFRHGWFYPGDRARLSDDGFLFIDGREDDVMNINGKKIPPGDIESVLLSHPSVVDAAAFVHATTSGDEVLAVAVIVSMPATTDEILQFAVEQLGPLAPVRVAFMHRFPRNTTGKLLRPQLAVEAGQVLVNSERSLH